MAPSQSVRSKGTTGRTGSSSRPGFPLQKIYSATHLDDNSHYHDRDDHEDSAEDEEEISIPKAEKTTSRESLGSEPEEEPEGPISKTREGLPGQRDVETGLRPRPNRDRTTSYRDPNLISWEGLEDPANPKNWPFSRKWAATIIVSSFTFISPVSSSMVAPALGEMSREFNIASEVETALMLSIFVLAYAIGPLILGPLSEIYGRVPVLQLSNLFFLVWNLACGFAQNSGQMLAFRFLSGLGGSAPLAIGGGVLSDCWLAEERGKAISIYSLAPLLGPAIGPIAGGFITENTTWRWAFWAVSIADGVIQIFGFFFLQETYAPTLLKKKAARLREETGNAALHTEWESPDRKLSVVLRTSLVRPFRLLGTQPIVQVLAIWMAFLYGLMYLVLSTFPTLWTDAYNESVGIGGLNYISLGLGFFLGTQICAPINDRIYRKLKKRNNDIGRPEFRAPLMIPGSLLTPIGLFWYGWSAQARLHWVMPNIGAVIFAAGTIIPFQCIQTYIVDSYPRFAASAIGAATVLRSLAGFGFPLFAPYMYAALDYGWGNSLLAFIAIVLGFPAPFLLWKYGQTLRAKSKFAAGA